MPDYSYNFGGSPGYGSGSFNFPSFQSMFGQSLPDLLSFLTQQKLALRQPELAVQKEMPGLEAAAQLQLLTPQLTSQKELAGMGYAAQQKLQQQAAAQELARMQEQAALAQQQSALDFLRGQWPGALADLQRSRAESQMWSQPYYGISTRKNLAPFGRAGSRIWGGGK